jgi:hypothetical protein
MIKAAVSAAFFCALPGLATGFPIEGERGSVACRASLYTCDIGVTIGWTARALAFPNHLAQTVHGLMMRIVERVAPGGQQLHGLAYAAWLVDGALFTDGQMHGQMQEGIGSAAFHVVLFFKRSVCVHKVCMVFGMLVQPLARYYFNSFKGLSGAGFGKNRTEKSADIGL